MKFIVPWPVCVGYEGMDYSCFVIHGCSFRAPLFLLAKGTGRRHVIRSRSVYSWTNALPPPSHARASENIIGFRLIRDTWSTPNG
jgi:hypothetical protein